MLTIQYLNASDFERANWGDNLGRVFFDLGDFEARLTKALDRDDFEQISQEAGLSGSIPATNKNRALLEKYRPDVLNRDRNPISIQVLQDGEPVPLDAAVITGFSESEQAFEFEPFGQSYLDLLELVNLSDVDLGTFEYEKANVKANWADRESLVQFGLAHYGAFNTPGRVTLQDFRPWFRLAPLMKKVACHIGWNFSSPHWENGDGAYKVSYLSDKYWHYYSTKTGERFVQLNISSPRSQPASTDFPLFDTVYDPNGLYNSILAPNQYAYGGFVDYDLVRVIIKVSNLTVTLPPSPAGKPAYTFVFGVYRTNGGAEYSFAHTEFITGSSDSTVTKSISFEYIDYEASGDETYQFFMFYQDLTIAGGDYSIYTLQSCDIDIVVDEPRLLEGDTIPLGELLSSDITGRKLLESMAHLCNGKVYTDYNKKEIVMYSPYDYLTPDGSGIIEGFYLSGAPIDLRAKTLTRETEWEDLTTKTERFRIYKFADSTDEYLSSDEVYSRRVDLGYGIGKETTIENPLFEPTGEITVSSDDVGGTGGIKIPALMDNLDGVLSSEIGPRVGVFYGLIDQNATWDFDGDIQTEVPYISQLPSFELPSGVDLIPLTFNGFARDIYNLHYAKEIEACRASVIYKLLIDGGDEVYDLITFRNKVLIQGEDSQLEVQPIAIRDHPYGKRVPILLEARPV